MPVLPAGPMPVAAKVRCFAGHHDDVSHARRDVLVAPWADVGLGGLVRLDEPHLDVIVEP